MGKRLMIVVGRRVRFRIELSVGVEVVMALTSSLDVLPLSCAACSVCGIVPDIQISPTRTIPSTCGPFHPVIILAKDGAYAVCNTYLFCFPIMIWKIR